MVATGSGYRKFVSVIDYAFPSILTATWFKLDSANIMLCNLKVGKVSHRSGTIDYFIVRDEIYANLGYGPADMIVHPPPTPSRTAESGFIFFA